MSSLPSFAATWLRQRDAGAAAVALVEDAELAALSDTEGLRLADALLGAVRIADIDDTRRTSSGLIEQQRLFARARR
jgi:hypothetical protein